MNTGVPDMRIPKLAAECGLTEQYEDVKITPSDGYVDGEWYGHQGVQVIEWPPLENCLTIDAEACKELRAVFHMLGEQVDLTLGEPKPLVWPNGARLYGQGRVEVGPCKWVSEKKPAPELIAKIDAWVARMSVEEPKPWPFPTGKAPEKQPEPEKETPPPLAASNGLLTEQTGRYASGLGFNGEE
jgi:hypothetical protein